MVRTKKAITPSTEKKDDSIRKHHIQSMEMAINSLTHTAVKEREFLSGTMAINSEKIDEAKDYIFDFYQKFMKKVEDGHQDKIYKINIQFFPCRQFDDKSGV